MVLAELDLVSSLSGGETAALVSGAFGPVEVDVDCATEELEGNLSVSGTTIGVGGGVF